MSTGQIGGLPNFMEWVQSISESTPIKTLFRPEGQESSWITKSEKERIDYILKVMPPPPMINWAAFQDISLHIPNHFGIHNVTAANELKSFGLTESSILFGAIGTWAGAQLVGGQLVQSLSSNENSNPINTTLQQYVENGSLTAVDTRDISTILHNLPFIVTMLHSAKSELVEKSYALAEQQVVLNLLDKWVESEAARAKSVREEIKELDMQHHEKMQDILRKYIENTIEKQEAMSQPTIGIIFSAFAAGPLLLTTVQSLFPALVGAASIVPAAMRPEFAALITGVLMNASTWATPIALSLGGKMGGATKEQFVADGAKAFALTIAAFVTDARFAQLFSAQLDAAIKKGVITPQNSTMIMITLKTSLLIAALAALYKAQTGGLTRQELQGVIDGTVAIEENNFIATLAKLIHEQIDQIPTKQREALLAHILRPYDNDADVHELTEPISTFLSLWDPNMFEETRLSTPG